MKRQQKPVTHQTKGHRPEPIKVESYAVDNVRDTQYGVFFDLTLNGVKVYGCKVVEGQEGKFDDFISYPSRRGTDQDGKDRYWSVVWAPLSDEDTKTIISAIEAKLGV